MPSDADLAYARAAASEVLRRGGKDASMPWENPASGARGTVTPIASAYTDEGRTCRDFLASYVTGTSQSWMQGEACRAEAGAPGKSARSSPGSIPDGAPCCRGLLRCIPTAGTPH